MDKEQVMKMDPNILVSMINMKLRDFYSNLEDLCYDIGIERSELEEKLSKANYKYEEIINQFK